MTRRGLSARQQRILSFIQEFNQIKGYPPTVREIGEHVGLRSSSTVHGHLKSLEALGAIVRDATLTRAIRVAGVDRTPIRRTISVPLVGRVAAGQPIQAESNVEETFAIPPEWTGGEGSFMLRVKGDSMIDAGVLDGDLVIVRPQQTANNGDMVVGLLGDEATVKHFFRESGRVRLQPANSHMKPIFTEDVTIVGKVVGVFRAMA